MNSLRILLVLGMVAGAGCQQEGVPQSQYDAKVREADSLRHALDEIVNGPERLLAHAKSAFAAERLTEARAVAQRIIDQHPGRPEAADAHRLLDRISTTEKSKQAAIQRARDKAMAGMVKKRDDMRSLTVWRDRSMPQYVNSRSWVGAYIMAPDAGPPYLRFVVYYTADDWLFIEKYLFKIDGRTYTLTPDAYGSDSVRHDNSGGGIWEWWDVAADGPPLSVLQALAQARKATIRHDGRQYYKDRPISAEERGAIARTLQALDVLRNS